MTVLSVPLHEATVVFPVHDNALLAIVIGQVAKVESEPELLSVEGSPAFEGELRSVVQQAKKPTWVSL